MHKLFQLSQLTEVKLYPATSLGYYYTNTKIIKRSKPCNEECVLVLWLNFTTLCIHACVPTT